MRLRLVIAMAGAAALVAAIAVAPLLLSPRDEAKAILRGLWSRDPYEVRSAAERASTRWDELPRSSQEQIALGAAKAFPVEMIAVPPLCELVRVAHGTGALGPEATQQYLDRSWTGRLTVDDGSPAFLISYPDGEGSVIEDLDVEQAFLRTSGGNKSLHVDLAPPRGYGLVGIDLDLEKEETMVLEVRMRIKVIEGRIYSVVITESLVINGYQYFSPSE